MTVLAALAAETDRKVESVHEHPLFPWLSRLFPEANRGPARGRSKFLNQRDLAD